MSCAFCYTTCISLYKTHCQYDVVRFVCFIDTKSRVSKHRVVLDQWFTGYSIWGKPLVEWLNGFIGFPYGENHRFGGLDV